MRGEPIVRAMEAARDGNVAAGETRAGHHVRGEVLRVKGPTASGEIVALVDNGSGASRLNRGWVPVEDLEWPDGEEA